MDAEHIAEGRARWQERYDAARKAERDYTTLSGEQVEPVYGPTGADDRMERIGWPGEYPFTRGIHPTGYRGKPWTIRQFAGFGTAKQTNERYKMILAEGGGGLSVAFDMPTLMGRDSDDPRSLGEVGHCGVAIDSAADMEILFDGIDLGATTTSMTISGPAVPVWCMYVVAAERQGTDPGRLNGTLQTDIFKEYIAQKEWIYPPEPHLKLIGDLMEYVDAHVPGVQAAVGVRLPHPRGRLDGRAGARVHPRRRVRLRRARQVARARRRPVRARPVVLLRRAHRLLRGDRQAARRPAHLGAVDEARSTARRPTARSGCASTPRPRASRSPPSSRTTTSCAPPSRRWPRCWPARTRCTPTRWTRCWPCRRRRPRRSRCAPSR